MPLVRLESAATLVLRTCLRYRGSGGPAADSRRMLGAGVVRRTMCGAVAVSLQVLASVRTLRLPTIITVLSALAFTACTRESERNPADLRALEAVRHQFGTRVELELESELYVRAKMLPDVTLSDPAMDSIYRAFFFTATGERRQDTRYVYLNVYQDNGRFLVQLWHDQQADSMIRGRTEHY